MSRSLIIEQRSNGSFVITGRGLGFTYERRGPWSLDEASRRALAIASCLRISVFYHRTDGGTMIEFCPRCQNAGCAECKTAAGEDVVDSDNCGPLCCEYGGHPDGPFCATTIDRELEMVRVNLNTIERSVDLVTDDAQAYLKREPDDVAREVSIAVTEIRNAITDLRRLLTPLPIDDPREHPHLDTRVEPAA